MVLNFNFNFSLLVKVNDFNQWMYKQNSEFKFFTFCNPSNLTSANTQSNNYCPLLALVRFIFGGLLSSFILTNLCNIYL